MKHQAYFTRALKARDPRYARIFDRMGYSTTDLIADDRPPLDIAAVRDLYERVVGKKPFHGWDIDTLKAKIEAKRAEA